MTPDKTNTQAPDPEKLVNEVIEAQRLVLNTSYDNKHTDEQFAEACDRREAAKAALLAEFTRLAKSLEIARTDSRELKRQVDALCIEKNDRELAALRPTPSPQGPEKRWMFSFKADGETPWQVCAGTYADMKALFDQRHEHWTDVYLSEIKYSEETEGAPSAPAPTPSEALTAPVEALDFVRDLAENGIRFDLNPTVPMHPVDAVHMAYLSYIKRIATSIRERAREALPLKATAPGPDLERLANLPPEAL